MVTREKHVSCINDIVEFIAVNDSLINLLGPFSSVKRSLRSTCCCDGVRQKDDNSVLDKDMMLFLKTREYRTKCIGEKLMAMTSQLEDFEDSPNFKELLCFKWTQKERQRFLREQSFKEQKMRVMKNDLMYSFSFSGHLDALLCLDSNPFTPYPNPFYIFSDICTRMNNSSISLPESYEAMKDYIENARKLVTLLETDKESTDYQEKKRRVDSFVHANSVIDSLVDTCEQWKKQTDETAKQEYFIRIHALQVELMKILSTECSSHYIERRKKQFDVSSLVCILRDPFSKLMIFLEMSSPLSYLHTLTDNWYITILAVIQQYYVLAIHEIIMYLVMFVKTYHFGNNIPPF